MKSQHGDSKKTGILSAIGTIVAIGLVLSNADLIYGLLSSVYPISNVGIISAANITAYWESQCINNVTTINWGTLSPGSSKSVTIYVKNTGSVALTLNMSTSNWNPSAARDYFTLSWNYAGAQISPNGVLSVTLTLAVSQNIQGVSSFSFDISIAGTQA